MRLQGNFDIDPSCEWKSWLWRNAWRCLPPGNITRVSICSLAGHRGPCTGPFPLPDARSTNPSPGEEAKKQEWPNTRKLKSQNKTGTWEKMDPGTIETKSPVHSCVLCKQAHEQKCGLTSLIQIFFAFKRKSLDSYAQWRFHFKANPASLSYRGLVTCHRTLKWSDEHN